MTNIKIFTKNKNIVAFEISGHTGYNDSGKDILCAAISSISQSACLGITKVLKVNAVINRNDKKGYLKLVLPKNLPNDKLEQTQIILKTMQISLDDLLFDYGDYIKMEVKDEIY
ncbi:MAG: ribosomal-processing cysteine protease Prp [Clostridia bacterium]|nr:ribosomal-processing cysteine protease Prp [Clostridia bacterium]